VAAPDTVDGDLTTRLADHVGQAFADQEIAFRDQQLRVEHPVRALDHRRLALGDQSRRNQPQVEQGQRARQHHRQQEIEHLQPLHAHVGRHRHHQQIR
jgi:hypothetical protein